jgi:murein DD-endopeptidase MepM/ murein hydrolase activator NlpD
MIWPCPRNTNITTPWDDPRPVTNPGKHVHGAIDIGTPVGAPIVAPESGELSLYFSVRHQDEVYWPTGEMSDFPFRNYFYDMFGGVAVLRGESGMTHLFAHMYMNPMHNKTNYNWIYKEQRADARFPVFCFIAGEIKIKSGEKIGEAGNSGFSFGSHVHYEIHEGFKWQPWGDRPDPEKIKWERRI